MRLTKETLTNLILEVFDDELGGTKETNEEKVERLINHEDPSHRNQGFELAMGVYYDEYIKAEEETENLLKRSMEKNMEQDLSTLAKVAEDESYGSLTYEQALNGWTSKLQPILDLIEKFDGTQESFDKILDRQHEIYSFYARKGTANRTWYYANPPAIKWEGSLNLYEGELEIDEYHERIKFTEYNSNENKYEYLPIAVSETKVYLLKKLLNLPHLSEDSRAHKI